MKKWPFFLSVLIFCITGFSQADSSRMVFIEGKITDRESGSPVENAVIELLYEWKTEQHIETSANGKFKLFPVMTDKKYLLKFYCSGYITRFLELDLTSYPDSSRYDRGIDLPLDMKLVKYKPEFNLTNIELKPSGKLYYNPKSGELEWDKVVTDAYTIELNNIKKQEKKEFYDPLFPPNTYQSKGNPHYWKNRKPFEGYWQQDVHYSINAVLNDSMDIIYAEEDLVYTNNSPDDLPFVYFHLYQEAFQPGSYYDKLQKANGEKPNYGPYESNGLGTEVDYVIVNGKPLKTEQDNTILKVYLNEPVKSGTSVKFHIRFKTYFDGRGGVGRRFKQFTTAGYKHYDGVHWYPRIAVYDRKFGWETDQHLGHEFYGDFGCYDVLLTFPANYILDATGNLLNKNEVLPDELMKKLDIKNFTKKVKKDSVSVITPYDPSKKKTWKFHAENVHDFAFTADPTYRIGRAEWNGIECISLAQEVNAHKWQNAAEYAAKIIQTYSEDFGMYVYHKMIVADARDGMEYPMLTLDGGGEPDYRGLLAHEIGHNWFFGQVGNNETYRAALDEGFTQFLTSWALEHIDGDTAVRKPPKSKFIANNRRPELVRENSVYNRYIQEALKGTDAFLNTHSDDFNSALRHEGGYRQVYYKTATMLYNLQYVLGDELFSKAMKHYFNQWKIAHPYMEDFRNSIIQFTDVDLNWFFDQWLETKKTIDYKVCSAKFGNEKDQYKIKFRRIGEMQMPVDFAVVGVNDSLYHFHIPNTWFVKNTSANVLPKWTGWGKINEEYEAVVTIPVGIKDVIIDPSGRLADVNRMNNKLKLPVTYSFDAHVSNQPDIKNYEVKIRPDIWYNGYDGIKPGVHFNGNYLNYKHVFSFNAWFNTRFFQNLPDEVPQYDGVNTDFDPVSFTFDYKTGLNKRLAKSNFFMSAKVLDGLKGATLGYEKKSQSEKIRLYSYFKIMYRKDSADMYYLNFPNEWTANMWNNTINFGMDKQYEYVNGKGFINFHIKSSSLGSDYSFAQFSMTSIHHNKIWRMNLRTRIFAQYGTSQFLAKESALFFSGGNPEEMMENKYTRSQGIFDYNWMGFGAEINHFQFGGGLNMRGYAGYVVPEEDEDGNITYHYSGNSGAAINAELDMRDIIKWKPKKISEVFRFDVYLFGDAGIISKDITGKKFDFTGFRADAGVGTALTIKKFGPLNDIKPLTVRFDMPLFLNRIPAVESSYFAFRWVLGVNRCF